MKKARKKTVSKRTRALQSRVRAAVALRRGRWQRQSRRITRIGHGRGSLRAHRAACVGGRSACHICAIGSAPAPRSGCSGPARCSPRCKPCAGRHIWQKGRGRVGVTGVGAPVRAGASVPSRGAGVRVVGAGGPCSGGAVVSALDTELAMAGARAHPAALCCAGGASRPRRLSRGCPPW